MPPSPAAIGAPQATGRLATGFSVAPPSGFTQNGPWYVSSSVENRGGGREIVSALVRLPPSVKAQGRMEDALAALWPTLVPGELADRRGAMVFRRYVGDGLPAHFASGTGREKDRIADTMVTLYLVDCGAEWQPVVVAQTYDEPDTLPGFLFGVDQAGRLSFPESAALAEPFLAALRCPPARGKPLASPAELAGDYAFGSAASQQWVNVYTGALSMTAVLLDRLDVPVNPITVGNAGDYYTLR